MQGNTKRTHGKRLPVIRGRGTLGCPVQFEVAVTDSAYSAKQVCEMLMGGKAHAYFGDGHLYDASRMDEIGEIKWGLDGGDLLPTEVSVVHHGESEPAQARRVKRMRLKMNLERECAVAAAMAVARGLADNHFPVTYDVRLVSDDVAVVRRYSLTVGMVQDDCFSGEAIASHLVVKRRMKDIQPQFVHEWQLSADDEQPEDR